MFGKSLQPNGQGLDGVFMGADGRRREGWFTRGCVAQAALRILGGPFLQEHHLFCLLENLWMNYLYNGILFSIKRCKVMMHATTWMNFENIKWKKPDTKGCRLYSSVNVKCPEWASP